MSLIFRNFMELNHKFTKNLYHTQLGHLESYEI